MALKDVKATGCITPVDPPLQAPRPVLVITSATKARI
jgi:hypothetical protein